MLQYQSTPRTKNLINNFFNPVTAVPVLLVLFIFTIHLQAQTKQAAQEQKIMQPISVIVEKSNIYGQHPIEPINPFEKWVVGYYLFDGVEKVVYTKTKITCTGKVKLTGQYKTVSGEKFGMSGTETQFVAEKWECVK